MLKKNLPLVGVIIVNWNGGEVTINCLKSLKKTSYKNYKTILVDNGSTDDSAEQLKKINKKMDMICLDKNYGYTIATNVGWKYALEKYGADYICAMDSDIVTIQPDWLDVQIAEMERNPAAGISSGKLAFPDGRLQIVNENSEKGYFEQDKGQYDYIKEIPYVRGGCIVIKKEVIDKIGYYDENFFYGPNDIDYCYRAKKAGFKVLFNGFSKSIHLAGYSGLSHRKDMIFGPQLEGMLICWFRHNRLVSSTKMVLRQFIRVFVTRKNPHAPMILNNLYLNMTFPKRLLSFFKAFSNALKRYRKIKQNSFIKILK